jgi:hypothetical protein
VKYIKSFESFPFKYDIDDYVLLDLDEVNKEWDIVDSDGNYVIDNLVVIVDKHVNFYYEVKFPSNDILHVKEKAIKRLLTIKEIEEFETKKSAKKYNI